MYEPKHEQSLYGDLIEGGEEGDDDWLYQR
jgi:hypothetical protein